MEAKSKEVEEEEKKEGRKKEREASSKLPSAKCLIKPFFCQKIFKFYPPSSSSFCPPCGVNASVQLFPPLSPPPVFFSPPLPSPSSLSPSHFFPRVRIPHLLRVEKGERKGEGSTNSPPLPLFFSSINNLRKLLFWCLSGLPPLCPGQ